KEYTPEVVRYFLMASHYRSPLNYSDENLKSAKAALERFYLCLRAFPSVAAKSSPENEYAKRFFTALSDDFNTPIALSVLFDLVREIHRLQTTDLDLAVEHVALLKYLANILGLLHQNPEAFLQQGQESKDRKMIEALIQKRLIARQNKDFTLADKIR